MAPPKGSVVEKPVAFQHRHLYLLRTRHAKGSVLVENPRLTGLGEGIMRKLPTKAVRRIPGAAGAKEVDCVLDIDLSCGNLTKKYGLGPGEEGRVLRALVESNVERAGALAPGAYPSGVSREEGESFLEEAIHCLETAFRVARKLGEEAAMREVLSGTLRLIPRNSGRLYEVFGNICAGALTPLGRRAAVLVRGTCVNAEWDCLRDQVGRAGEGVPFRSVFPAAGIGLAGWQASPYIYFEAVAEEAQGRGLEAQAKAVARLSLLCMADSWGGPYKGTSTPCFSKSNGCASRFYLKSGALLAPHTEGYLLPSNYVSVAHHAKRFGIFPEAQRLAREILPTLLSSGGVYADDVGYPDPVVEWSMEAAKFINEFRLGGDAAKHLESMRAESARSCAWVARAAKGMRMEEYARRMAGDAMDSYMRIRWWRRRRSDYEGIARLDGEYGLEGKKLKLARAAKEKVRNMGHQEAGCLRSGGSGGASLALFQLAQRDAERMDVMGGNWD